MKLFKKPSPFTVFVLIFALGFLILKMVLNKKRPPSEKKATIIISD